MLNQKVEKNLNRGFFEYLSRTNKFSTQIGETFMYLNKNTLHFDKNTNTMYIYHLDTSDIAIKFCLTSVNMKFSEQEIKQNQKLETFYKELENNYTITQEIQFFDQDARESPHQSATKISSSNQNNGKSSAPPINFPTTTNSDKLPLNILLNPESQLAVIYSTRRVFVCRLDKEKSLTAKEINCSMKEHNKIMQIKWHPELHYHVGVLTDEAFLIFNLWKDEGRKKEEFFLSFKPFPLSNETFCSPVDFELFTYTEIEDFRRLTVMFMDAKGQFFYYTPVFLAGMTLNAKDWDSLREKMTDLYPSNFFNDRYLRTIFETTMSEINDDGTEIVISNATLQDERICKKVKNAIQGPLIKVQGEPQDKKKDKKHKRHKEFTNFMIVPYKRSLVIIAVKKSGRIDVLFSMDLFHPYLRISNDESSRNPFPPIVPHEDFHLLVVAKFGLIDYMKNDLDKERLAAPDLKQFDTNAKIFNQIKESSLVKLFSTGMGMNSSEIKFTQAVVGLYQNVYLLKLPWVDQIELHLKNGTWFQNELTPEMLKSDIELVIHNNLKEKHEVKDLNPFQLGFYGLTLVNDNVFLLRGWEDKVTSYSTMIFSQREELKIDTANKYMSEEQKKAYYDNRVDLPLKVESHIDSKLYQIELLRDKISRSAERVTIKTLQPLFEEAKTLAKDLLGEFVRDAQRIQKIKNIFTDKKKKMEEESVKVIEEKKKKIQDQVTAVMDKMTKNKERLSKIVHLITRNDAYLDDDVRKCKNVMIHIEEESQKTSKEIEELKEILKNSKEDRKQIKNTDFRFSKEFEKDEREIREKLGDMKLKMREVNERLDTLLRMGEKMKLLPPEDEARFKKLMKK